MTGSHEVRGSIPLGSTNPLQNSGSRVPLPLIVQSTHKLTSTHEFASLSFRVVYHPLP